MNNLLLIFLFVSCAQLYHIQIGEMDDDPAYDYVPIDIKVSEWGVDIQQAGKLAKMSRTKLGATTDKVAEIIGLFEMGPHTGYGVFSDKYANEVAVALYQKCPDGVITGVQSIRENRSYPVISGEIIKVTGYCKIKRS